MVYDPSHDRYLVFFRPEVLSPYREQADKYELRTDHFEGKVTLAGPYYQQLNDQEREAEYIEVKFGYRTLKNGELCVVAFIHDLKDKSSKAHGDRWAPFIVKDAEWLDYADDQRFSLWYRRYVEGDWDVDNGPAFQLMEEVRIVNGLTLEAVGMRLYEVGDDPPVIFPAAENTWRYEDAHISLYAILIDGLSLPCMRLLAVPLKRKMDPAATQTRNALQKTLLPSLEGDPNFAAPMANVSTQRGKAAHTVRAPATAMKAFGQFSNDLEACVVAVRLVRTTLEREFGMDANKSRTRQEAINHLPEIAKTADMGDSVNAALGMRGKTVATVEVGTEREIKDRHQTEVVIIHFTDGSIMSIVTGSNAGNFSCEKHRAQDFHVDFRVQWVPPKQ